MGFWDKVAGGSVPPAQPRQPSPGVPQQVPWYQQGLPTAPQPQPQAVPQQQVPQEEGLELIEGEMLDPNRFRKAEHRRKSIGNCPACGGEHYAKPNGMPNAMEQCFTCGYNPRFGEQSGSAGIPDSNTGPAQPARQISTANNFNPQTVVAKINF
jgi:hypothetical protein